MFVREVDIIGLFVALWVHIIRLHDAEKLFMLYIGLFKSSRMIFSGYDALVLNRFRKSFGEVGNDDAELLSRLGLNNSGCGYIVVILT